MPDQGGYDAFAVDRRSQAPLFRQIYEWTRAAIVAGRLRPGERLPSARSPPTSGER